MKHFLFSSVFFVACKGRLQENELKVINGIEIPDSEFPEVLKITSDEKFCSGVVVSPRFILTAAHCIWSGLDRISLTVHANGQSYFPSDIHFFRGYDPLHWESTRRADLAILELQHPTFDKWLPITFDPLTNGSQVTMVGYGSSEYKTQDRGATNKKRKGTNTFLEEDFHYRKVTKQGQPTREKVTAAEYRKSDDMVTVFGECSSVDSNSRIGTNSTTGGGDSGGALIQNGKLVAITSGGGYGYENASDQARPKCASFALDLSFNGIIEGIARHVMEDGEKRLDELYRCKCGGIATQRKLDPKESDYYYLSKAFPNYDEGNVYYLIQTSTQFTCGSLDGSQVKTVESYWPSEAPYINREERRDIKLDKSIDYITLKECQQINEFPILLSTPELLRNADLVQMKLL